MIKSTLLRIMNQVNEDINDSSQQILKIGIKKVLQELSQPLDCILYPEQIIKLLSVLHYMIQQQTLSKDLFVESNIYIVTNNLNASFTVERLQTDQNMTISRSINLAPSWEGTPKQSQTEKYFQAQPEYRKSATDQKIEIQQIREPLTYQQILQLYYTYLKRMCLQNKCDIPLLDCFVIQNIQCLGLRIIEGQRNLKLRSCFKMIIKDLIEFQDETIEMLKEIIGKKDQEKLQINQIYLQMYLNSKQLKFFGNMNRIEINQERFKQFKANYNFCTQKYRIQLSNEQMEKKDLNDEKNFYKYERTQLYKQF